VGKMEKLSRSIILFLILFLSFANVSMHSCSSGSTKYQVDPSLVILGESGSVIGTEFTVNVTVSDAVDLSGFSIDFSWNTTYLHYVSHTAKVPVETYPDGVLHEPIIVLADDVDATAGTYWLAASTLTGDPFNGNGTVFEMTFRIINQPYPDEVPPPPNNFVSLPLLLDETYEPCEDGELRLYAIPPTHPPYPMLKVVPETFGDKRTNETFPVDAWLMGGGGDALEPFFDVSGAEIYLNFNSSLVEAVEVTIDPDGWFASFWPTGINEIIQEINNTAGTVRVVFNASDETHTPVFGMGSVLRVEFKAVFESSEWPPLSCTIGLKNPPPRPLVCGMETQVYLEGYQHPEREYCPWNNSDSRVPLPHSVENATYLARYEAGVTLTIHSPGALNYSRETVWLNVTANIPVEEWWYCINSGGNLSFTPNSAISVAQCINNLTIYASSYEMIGFAAIQFYALNGDFDEDRDVDIYDIVLLGGTYGSHLDDPDYRPEYDMEPPPFGDGDIDIYDVVIAAANYGKSC